MKLRSLALALLVAGAALPPRAAAQDYGVPSTADPSDPAFIDNPEQAGTFSVIGRDPATGELGVAVHSKTLAVGSRVRGGKGGVAVFAHQAGSNPLYSRIGVELIEAGWSPKEALDFMIRGDSMRNSRQVAVVDMQGRSAAWTSTTSSDWKGHKCGVDYCAQGNTLAGPQVVEAMARAMEESAGKAPLAERLLAALTAGNDAGGDRRGVQSAGLLILYPRSIADFGDWALDLRVDDHRDPFGELKRILDVRRSQDAMQPVNRMIAAGDYSGAMATARKALELAPTQDGVHVTMAHIHLLEGRKAEALAELRTAVGMNRWNRAQLQRDARFEALRADPEFQRLVSGS